jgi:hypothetical protein
MAQVAAAHRHVETGHKKGTVVITMDERAEPAAEQCR